VRASLEQFYGVSSKTTVSHYHPAGLMEGANAVFSLPDPPIDYKGGIDRRLARGLCRVGHSSLPNPPVDYEGGIDRRLARGLCRVGH
jgi:hypothetical protein